MNKAKYVKTHSLFALLSAAVITGYLDQNSSKTVPKWNKRCSGKASIKNLIGFSGERGRSKVCQFGTKKSTFEQIKTGELANWLRLAFFSVDIRKYKIWWAITRAYRRALILPIIVTLTPYLEKSTLQAFQMHHLNSCVTVGFAVRGCAYYVILIVIMGFILKYTFEI